MSNDVLITPASRKIEFKDSSSNVDAKIETDSNGNLIITNPGGDISLGDTTADIFIGDGVNNIDLVFEQNGEIRGTSGVTITLGASGSNVVMGTDLNLSNNDITNVNDLTIAGNLTVTGTTTTLETATLNVEDKNITLNYGSGDTSGSANGAGITIQDAVNSTTDATLLWNASSDGFEFSHKINVAGNVDSTGGNHTFYSGDGDIHFDIGRNANERIQIYVDDGEIKLTADQDSDGNAEHRFILDRTFDGTGANNFIIRKGGSDQLLVDTNGNVGIGTSSPSYMLDVGGGDFFVNGTNRDWGGTGGLGTHIGTGDFDIYSGVPGGGTHRVRVTNAGKVGIGTSFPDTKLHVEGTAKFTKLRYTGGNETEGDEAITFRWNKPDNATSTTTWFKVCDVDIGTGLYKALSMVIKVTSANGNFGNSSDIEELYYVAEFNRSGAVQDDADFAAIYGTNGNNCQLRIYKTGTGAYELQMKTPTNYRSNLLEATVNSANNGTVTVTDNDTTAGTTSGGTEYLVQAPTDSGEGHYTHVFPNINVTNNVGIGTGNATTPLDVHGIVRVEENSNTAFYGGNYVRVFNDQNYGFRNSGGTTKALISMSGNSYFGGGNVGIGDSSPSAKLHVVGAVQSASSQDYGIAAFENTNLEGLSIGYDADDNFTYLYSREVGVSSRGLNLNGSLHILSYNNNVGIGTNSPGAALHVYDDRDITANNEAKGIRLSESSGDWLLSLGVSGVTNTGFAIRDNALDTYPFVIRETSGNVGIGVSSPSNKLDVSGHIEAGSFEFNAVSGTAVHGTGLRVPASQTMALHTNSAERMRIDSSGRVGIGTTSPSQPLTVSGADSIGIDDYVLHNGDTNTKFGFNAADSFKVRTGGGDRFVVTNNDSYFNNQVGIGKSSPDYKLHILESGANVGAAYFEDGTSWLRVVPNLGSGGFNPMSVAGDIGFIFSTDADASTDSGTLGLLIAPHSDNASGIKICEDGDVGIGTTTPAYKLSVNSGTSDWPGYFKSTDNKAGIIIVDDDTTGYFGVESSRAFMGLQAGIHANNLNIDSSGQVGIGTSSPNNKLTVNGASDGINIVGTNSFVRWNSGDMMIRNEGSYAMGFHTYDGSSAMVERMRIDSSGNVGIGTNSPSGNLHIKSLGNVGDALLIVEADADNNVESDNPRIELRQDNNLVSGALYLEGNDAQTATNSLQNTLLLDAKGASDNGGTIQFATGGLAANQSGGPTNSSVRMTILRDGKVGIGTTNPTAKLEVNGGIKASGTSYFNGSVSLNSGGQIGSGFIVSGDFEFEGADYSILFDGTANAIEWQDNAKATFGTGNDLQIYHDGSNSRILDNGTGFLAIGTNGSDIRLTGNSFNEYMAKFVQDGAVELYHNGSKKLETTSNGISVTGIISTSGNLDMNANSIIDIEQLNGTGGTGWLDFNMDADNVYPQASTDNQTVLGSITHMNFVGDSNGNGTGGIFYWGYGVDQADNGTFTQTMALDRDGDLTAEGTITASGDINTTTGTIQINGNDVITEARSLTNIATLSINALSSPSVFSVNSSGNTEVGGTFQVLSNTTLDGDLSVGDDLTVTGGFTDLNKSRSSTTDPILELHNTNSTNYNGQYFQIRDHNGTVRGTIGTKSESNINMYISGGGAGLKFSSYITYKVIRPVNDAGTDADNQIDLGTSSARFDDIYATNGTIQTSDRNEKQDIQALTDAEQRVAVACKGLIRRFRWQDSVAEKDNNPDSSETARYHFGIIAQDLQDAFTAEGLDAGDYAMFISQTWTDDEGNEQTRLGVRYNELLAFIIATL